MHEKIAQIKQQFMQLEERSKIGGMSHDQPSSIFDTRQPGEFEYIYIMIHSVDAGNLKSDDC